MKRSDNPNMPFKASVPESLMPSSVKEEMCKESDVPTAMKLERSATLGEVILHFFKSNVFKFLSSGSFSISTAMPSEAFSEKSKPDKEQVWPAKDWLRYLYGYFSENLVIIVIYDVLHVKCFFAVQMTSLRSEAFI